MKTKLSIRDNAFGHSPISNSPTPAFIGPETSPIEWDRESPETKETIYTDGSIRVWIDDHYGFKCPGNSRIWLIEPNQDLYDWVVDRQSNFSEIWTADKDVLSKVAHARFLTNAGCWIRPEDRGMGHHKTKNVSTIASNKRGPGGYNLRHLAIRTFKSIDAYGSEYTQLSGPTQSNKIDGLRNYRFHLCIENCRRDYFFTEKLIDCFMTGTIPIYWGCPSIARFFNVNGMILLDEIDPMASLAYHMKDLSRDNFARSLYERMLQPAMDNYDRAKRYVLTEEVIMRNLLPK